MPDHLWVRAHRSRASYRNVDLLAQRAVVLGRPVRHRRDPLILLQVDIKPGDDPNCVNPKSNGVTPIAVLATEDFDPAEIVGPSVAVDGVAPVHDGADDVNDDGLVDRVFHFFTRDLADAGLLTDGNELVLTGVLVDGTAAEGSDMLFLAPGPNC